MVFSLIGSYLPVADSEYFDKNSQQVGGRAEYPWRRATLMMENPCLELLITLLKTNRNMKIYVLYYKVTGEHICVDSVDYILADEGGY